MALGNVLSDYYDSKYMAMFEKNRSLKNISLAYFSNIDQLVMYIEKYIHIVLVRYNS